MALSSRVGTMQSVGHSLGYNTGLSGDIPKKTAEDELLTARLRKYAAIGYSLIFEGAVATYAALRNYAVQVPRFFRQMNPALMHYAQFANYSNIQFQDGVLAGIGAGFMATGVVLMFDIVIDSLESQIRGARGFARGAGYNETELGCFVVSLLLGYSITAAFSAESEFSKSAAKSGLPPDWAVYYHNLFAASLNWAFNIGMAAGAGIFAIGAGCLASYLAYDTYQQRKLLRKKNRIMLDGSVEKPFQK